MADNDGLKDKTARTLKWNLIDRLSTQLLYALTGIVLARMLSQEDFGLVGAVLIFQAFASLLIDSGFSYALIQRKSPTRLDYSTVLWFNIGVAAVIYVILWFCAPLIARCFQNDMRLIGLSRVMFLVFIINAAAIVQTNRLVKKMDVRMVAVSNSVGLVAGAVTGITLALYGFGAWAIVWQNIAMATVKTSILWATGKWLPMMKFSWAALKSFSSVGSGMMFTSFLNTVFQNIYSFFVGNRVGLASLGYYTQGDKWSKMGVTSISQVLTSSFLPVLSAVQDDPGRFRRLCSKMNRFTAYLVFPALIGLIVIAEPIFHLLFGTKWDPSIILFQLLLVRGIFFVLTSLYNNFLLALGRSGMIVRLEMLRDTVAIAALVASLPFIAQSTPDNPVYGLTLMLWGQVAASAISWAATLYVTARTVGSRVASFLFDLVPYAVMTVAIIPLMLWIMSLTGTPLAMILAGAAIAIIFYLGINAILGSKIQKEVLGYLHLSKKINS